jgi:hypothetical protein
LPTEITVPSDLIVLCHGQAGAIGRELDPLPYEVDTAGAIARLDNSPERSEVTRTGVHRLFKSQGSGGGGLVQLRLAILSQNLSERTTILNRHGDMSNQANNSQDFTQTELDWFKGGRQ